MLEKFSYSEISLMQIINFYCVWIFLRKLMHRTVNFKHTKFIRVFVTMKGSKNSKEKVVFY